MRFKELSAVVSELSVKEFNKGRIMSNLKTKVILLTKYFRVEGEIDLLPGARLTDFMNVVKSNMVVTDATVSDHNGKELLRGEFINVLVRNIEIILPAASVL